MRDGTDGDPRPFPRHRILLLEQRIGFNPACGIDEPEIACLLYTSDAADERSSVDLGGRRIIKKKKTTTRSLYRDILQNALYQRTQ